MSFDYNAKINPLVSKLTEKDTGSAEANAGQMREIIKDIAELENEEGGVLDTLKEYADHLKSQG